VCATVNSSVTYCWPDVCCLCVTVCVCVCVWSASVHRADLSRCAWAEVTTSDVGFVCYKQLESTIRPVAPTIHRPKRYCS